MANSTVFDPFSQSFTLRLRDGTPFEVSMVDLDEYVLYGLQISINYAAQLGASLLFLIILLLLTKPDKRSSPIFIINIVALTLNFLRNLLQCLYYTGPFSQAYAYFAADFSRVSASDFADQVAITVLNWILLVCVETSLLLQVRVVCVTAQRAYRQFIFGVSGLVAGLAIGFRLASCIMNSKYIISLEPTEPLRQLVSATNITTSISICWFCLVFVIKLGFAIDQRKRLGVGSFGPMQIIFIMGCQTLIIPANKRLAIFSIVEYVVDLPSMDSNVLTLVTIFLPLSSLWASASLDHHHHKPTAEPKHRHGKFLGNDNTASTGPLVDETFLIAPLTPTKTTTTTTTSRLSQSNPPSPKTPTHHHDFVDLEAQKADER
ncbi:MAG: hypothetical protein Q9182_006205 [Xanthomendoza sp. 2 TL-2023]